MSLGTLVGSRLHFVIYFPSFFSSRRRTSILSSIFPSAPRGAVFLSFCCIRELLVYSRAFSVFVCFCCIRLLLPYGVFDEYALCSGTVRKIRPTESLWTQKHSQTLKNTDVNIDKSSDMGGVGGGGSPPRGPRGRLARQRRARRPHS